MEKIIILGNGVDWGEITLEDFVKKYGAKIYNTTYPCKANSIEEKIIKFCLSKRYSKIIPPFIKNSIYRLLINNLTDRKYNKVWLIIYDHNRLGNDKKFLAYVRKKIAGIKLIYMFTNIVSLSYAADNNFVEKLNMYYDLVYAFDPKDSIKYGFKYSPLLYSARDVNRVFKNQIFYVGKAKDRYDKIIAVYKKLQKFDIKRKFFITEVQDDMQVDTSEIVYNKYIDYETALEYILQSSCLLDIIQGDSTGFTIKVCEAIVYNKLLITTNSYIKKTPFYDERYIRVINSPDDIDETFFENWNKVHYSELGKKFFSIDTFIENVKNDLK